MLFLAALMLLGSFYYVIAFTFINARADESTPLYEKDFVIRVGLMYGSKVTVGFKVQAENGFEIGFVDSDNNYKKLWQVTDSILSVTCDANLINSDHTISKATDDNADIGGYHLQISSDAENFSDAITALKTLLKDKNIPIFPAYIKSEIKIRFGSYSTKSAAKAARDEMASIIENIEIAEPTYTAVSAINPETNNIVFEYDSEERNTGLALCAVQSGSGYSYIKTPAENIYLGIFRFSRYKTDSTDGVAVTNIIPIDEYIAGVLPYEIGVLWHDEAQKAFSIAVRSYALSKYQRHENMDFDMCNTICCQVYRGCGRTTEQVRENIKATSGEVLSYNGKIIPSCYSSSVGGSTVSAADAWGSTEESNPFLRAIPTPWEKYEEYGNGKWSISISPKALAKTLVTNGYTAIKGDIQSVKINSLCKNSSYVYSITFTDVYNNEITITRSDRIRIALSPYLKSANFVVGKAGETVSVTDYTYEGFDEFLKKKAELDESASEEQTETTVGVLTATGEYKLDLPADLSVITAGGIVSARIEPEKTEAEKLELPDLSNLKVVTKTREITLEGNAGDFVFEGRGWGHGVGLSQWGIKDLADLGYDYATIIKTYYYGSEIVYYYTLVEN